MNESVIVQYSYWALLVWVAIDHTGTPSALIFALGLVVIGKLNLMTVLFVCFAGSLIADIIFFIFGRIVRNSKLTNYVNKYPKLYLALSTTQNRIEKNGPSIIIWGRFVALISRYIPFVYGLSNFDSKKFILYSFIGSIVMNYVLGLIVYLLWNSISEYLKDDSAIILVTTTLTVLPIFVILIYKYIRK